MAILRNGSCLMAWRVRLGARLDIEKGTFELLGSLLFSFHALRCCCFRYCFFVLCLGVASQAFVSAREPEIVVWNWRSPFNVLDFPTSLPASHWCVRPSAHRSFACVVHDINPSVIFLVFFFLPLRIVDCWSCCSSMLYLLFVCLFVCLFVWLVGWLLALSGGVDGMVRGWKIVKLDSGWCVFSFFPTPINLVSLHYGLMQLDIWLRWVKAMCLIFFFFFFFFFFFWRSWKEVCHFRAHDEPVARIESAYVGRIATTAINVTSRLLLFFFLQSTAFSGIS